MKEEGNSKAYVLINDGFLNDKPCSASNRTFCFQMFHDIKISATHFPVINVPKLHCYGGWQYSETITQTKSFLVQTVFIRYLSHCHTGI